MCRTDSIRMPYGRYGVKRICVNCIEDHDRKRGREITDAYYAWLDVKYRTDAERDAYRPMILSIPKAYVLRP